MSELLRRAAFLDRDGTLIADPGYLGEPEGVILLPGVAAALAELRAAGFLTVVVSNQSGVARGYFDTAAVEAVNRRMTALLASAHAQARIDAIYFCPHGPADACGCRKPQPGLFLQAARELQIDLPGSVCFGDSERDIQAGAAAGCGGGHLVSPSSSPSDSDRAGQAVPSLLGAVRLFLQAVKERPQC